ncbi:hypothetical protein [Flindersiella endophytica]
MIILGLVLVGLAAAATAGMVIGGGQQTAVEIGSLRVETTTSGFFLFGFGLAIALIGGLQLVVVGFKHWRRRRQELETLRSKAQPTSAPPATQPEPAAVAEPSGSEHAAEVEPSPGAAGEPPAIEGGRAARDQGEPESGRAATAPAQVGTTPPAVPDEDQR